MKPFRTVNSISSCQRDLNTIRSVDLIIVTALLLIAMTNQVHAEFWFEDLTDGNLSDSGIDWVLTPSSSSSSDGLELNSPNGNGAGVARADLPIRGRSWSVRTEARLLRDVGVFGAGAGNTFNGIGVDGWIGLGKGGDVLSEAMSDFRPAEEDMIVQFDTFDHVLRMWAWRGSDPPAEDIAPLVEVEVNQQTGDPFLWTNSLVHPTATAQFSWIAISTEHMPVNMPVPLSDLIGDFSGDDTLDVNDINLLVSAIQHGKVDQPFDLNQNGNVDTEDHAFWLSDLKHTWIGDANLDGQFNSSDFVEVFQAGKYETNEPAGWNEGDWNADGVFGSSDFVSAFQGGGYEKGARSSVSVVAEPSSGFLFLLGLVSVRYLRTTRNL